MEELAYWIAKDRIDPIGLGRADINADTIANVLVSLNTPKNQKFTARKYTPDYRKHHAPVVEQSPEQIRATVLKFHAMFTAGSR